MPVTPIPNCGSQIDRAICAYLIDGGCGNAENVSPAHSTGTNTYPRITVKAFQGTHDPVLTGNESWQVQIQVKGSAANAKGEPNQDGKRVELDRLVGLVLALMLQSDDGGETLDATASAITTAGRALKPGDSSGAKTWAHPSNNDDMDAFTCRHVYYKSQARGEPDEQGASWVEVRTFEVRACPANVD